MKVKETGIRKERKCPGLIPAEAVLTALLFVLTPAVHAGDGAKAGKPEVEEIGFYQDVFDQNFYSEAANQFDLGRWGRKLFHKKIPSANVNIFDEVPDSSFFTNRHARRKLPVAELEQGFRETEGPDMSRPLTVIGIEQEGLECGFLVEDARKDRYILRFDPQNHAELNTAAELIASRFYHALGYNVPQYTLLIFKPEQLAITPDAVAYDNTGFVKKLTQELLDRYLVSMLQNPDGSYRASAGKIPPGEEAGSFNFWSRRKNDPEDSVNHRDRREIRALGIFSAWLNDHGLYESNTVDMKVTENGKTAFKHYLTDFTCALGASTGGPKPPMFGYEYIIDYGETFKTMLALGFREKPWQKKWREAGEQPDPNPAVGYFSNQLFDPAKFKPQLPYEAFRIATRADGFWAAKIMASFSDDDIRAMVRAGQYTDPAAADTIAKTLIERRDIIVRHWLSQVNPLDGFEFSNGKLSFRDLAAERGFEKKEGTVYTAEVFADGKAKKPRKKVTAHGTEFMIDPSWYGTSGGAEVLIRALRLSSSKESPFVKVILGPEGVRGIRRED